MSPRPRWGVTGQEGDANYVDGEFEVGDAVIVEETAFRKSIAEAQGFGEEL